MKLSAIWFCGNRSVTKGASEDRLAQFFDLLEVDTQVPRDCSRWVIGLAGERGPWCDD